MYEYIVYENLVESFFSTLKGSEMKSQDPIIVEQTFDIPIKKIWWALTDIDEMKKWYFDNIPAFKPEVGFKTSFQVFVQDRVFTHLWKITEVVPPHIIRYNWKFEEYPGESLISFELQEKGNQVKLRLTAEVLKDFPSDIPEFKRESGLNGWNYFIKKSLKEYLSK